MQIRVAAYAVVVREDGRMLLPHWSEGDRGGWPLPGCGLDPGDGPAAAAGRASSGARARTWPGAVSRGMARAAEPRC